MLKHCTQCGDPQPSDARFCPRCGLAIVAGAEDPMLGKVVAERYRLVEKIGQGGSGTIYRAEHVTLRKRVAVKILHHQLSTDDTAVERFRREATTVCELDNDHILQVLDFGRAEDKRLFFAMEFLEGETLTKVLERDKQLSIPRVIDILTQTGEALMEAHGLGYIHRDLRPRNIFLITRRGRADFVKLLDFGLAKLVLPEAESKQTAMGMTFGDPRYMSPEQARGDVLDRRADIYSLGAVAFEMLTGTPPFSGSGTFEVLQQHLDATVPSVRYRRADCPEWLDAVVQRSLAKSPDERFSTVLKLIECLREQKAPQAADASEKAAHATLSATKPEPAAAKAPEPARAHKETLALGTVRGPSPKGKKEKAKKADAEAAAASSGEVAATPAVADPPAPAAGPTVVVDSGAEASAEAAAATPAENEPIAASAPIAAAASESNAAASQPVAADATLPEAAPSPAKRRSGKHAMLDGKGREPSGEWFDSGIERSPGVVPYDEQEEYEQPKKSRGPLIIFSVAGGLTLLIVIVILALPKPTPPAEKPSEPVAAAPAAPTPAPPPAPAPAAPAAAAPVAAQPSGAAASAAPTGGAAPAAAPAPSTAPAKAAVAQVAPPPPLTIIEPEPTPPPKAAAPKEASKPSPSKSEASAKPSHEHEHEHSSHSTKVAAAEAKSEPKKHDKAVPEGFRDPFSETPKPASANEERQAEFFVKLGRQKLGSSDFAAAAANFTKAREYDPRSPDAIAGLGEVAFEQGDYNGASTHLKQALRLSPNRPRFLVLLGQAYYKLGRPKDAVTEYRKALRLDPGNQEAQRSLEVAERKLAQGS
jgi:serine/threonine-protein kinase